jgi:hypothetical protein
MKTYIDRKKVGTRAELSNLASIGGLVLLLVSVLLPLFLPKAANFSFLLMVVGLGTAMLGIFYANRWVRKPRPEERLDKALKGLADSYHLYHYPSFPPDHLLLTPNGLVILETIGRALRSIVEEHVGNPIKSALRTEQALRERIGKVVQGTVPIKPVVVFVHPAAELEIEKAPILVLPAEKLKKQVTIDAPRLDQAVYDQLDAYFQKMTLNK